MGGTVSRKIFSGIILGCATMFASGPLLAEVALSGMWMEKAPGGTIALR